MKSVQGMIYNIHYTVCCPQQKHTSRAVCCPQQKHTFRASRCRNCLDWPHFNSILLQLLFLSNACTFCSFHFVLLLVVCCVFSFLNQKLIVYLLLILLNVSYSFFFFLNLCYKNVAFNYKVGECVKIAINQMF